MTTLATLAQAREAFRQSPNQSTALAYMDAAIAQYMALDTVAEVCSDHAHDVFAGQMQEIRDWLAIPQVTL